MALSGTLPIIWGLYTSRLNDAAWIALTSEAVSWVELKGSFTWRVRTLLAAAVLALIFSLLGTATGYNVWLSVAAMFVVGFFATLLKNIGDRASGLALCVYLMFIICNAFPAAGYAAIEERMALIGIGAAWPLLLGITFSMLKPAQEPFRRQIALIWRAISELIDTLVTYTPGKNINETRDLVYQKEKDIRTAIDNSYDFYGRMVHQVSKKDHQQYQLALLRKAAGLVAINIIAIGEELESINVEETNETLRLKFAALFNAMKEAVTRISVFVITLKPEEKLLAISHINRLKNLTALISQYPLPPDEKQFNAINRILKYAQRSTRLLENAIQRIDQMGKDIPVFRSYSLIKTSFLLKPKYLLKNITGLFNFNTLTNRYALRSAIAAAIALFINKWFNIDHGYWLPLSVMIIKQPYFGATLKKAADRIAGTLLGVLAGSLLLHVPTGLHIKEVILFLTFVFMVYYIRKQYAVAAFIITLNLVLLFNIESAYNNMLMVTRILCTIGGALLAIASGFALLPAWDKKWLPSHLAGAINANYEYFKATFFSSDPLLNWTKSKRITESKNSDVFDSFNRYIEEPGKEKSALYYDLATYNVRITRNLNNIHLEQDEKKETITTAPSAAQQSRINECLNLFNKVMQQLSALDAELVPKIIECDQHFSAPFMLNDTQMLSLEKLIIELKTMDLGMAKLLH